MVSSFWETELYELLVISPLKMIQGFFLLRTGLGAFSIIHAYLVPRLNLITAILTIHHHLPSCFLLIFQKLGISIWKGELTFFTYPLNLDFKWIF